VTRPGDTPGEIVAQEAEDIPIELEDDTLHVIYPTCNIHLIDSAEAATRQRDLQRTTQADLVAELIVGHLGV
jgi:hypothetical protein